jgi:NADH-quinone oxidoreductase subunit N
MYLNYLASISRYIPELTLVVLMVGLILIEATYAEDEKNKKYIFITTCIGLVVTLACLVANLSGAPEAIFSNSMIIDPFSTVMKIVMVLGTFGAFYLSSFSKDIYESLKTELHHLGGRDFNWWYDPRFCQ